MTFIEMYPVLTVVPPILAIILVIATKRVLISLGIGIVSAALLVANFDIVQTLNLVWTALSGIFWSYEDGAPNWGKIFILLFLVTLGVVTSLVMMSGGTTAFAEWTLKRIKTRRGAQLLAAGLGTAIFIDDYFNALAVGQVGRPVTDCHHVSRAKLSYLIDSTSAPVAILAPFSSWGASIIGILAPLVAAAHLPFSEAEAFIRAAAMNFYAIGALILIYCVIAFEIDFGPMRKEERRAIVDKVVLDPEASAPGQLSENLPRHEPGAMRALIVPFILLVIGVIGGMLLTGYWAIISSGEAGAAAITPMDMLANTDVSMALNFGGGAGLLGALYYYFRYTRPNPLFDLKVFWQGVLSGAQSMMGAISILVFAWMLGELIGALGTGEFLGSVVESMSLPAIWLVPVMFLVAAGMAFATGTSWGSFGILLPIAGHILAQVPGGNDVLIAAFGAVLAGAVWGDHCSPISDTTILSATGAGAPLITHVNTQLPYAIAGAVCAFIGYILYAVTSNGIVGFVAMLTAIAIFVFGARLLYPSISEVDMERRLAESDASA
ncbi:MAG: Na+/H+ antiporter NhaC family protein [Actinomycetaceae bacterium]|nr:Na+/H+ antiporter NhaC family protein [Actinomycetaceae bacterium]